MSTDLLTDRIEAADLIYAYAARIDSLDFGGLRDTLDDNCRVCYGNMEWVVGADATINQIATATQGMAWQHHFLNVYSVEIDGDTAKALVYHTSHQAAAAEPGTASLLVGRYLMRLRRAQGRWKLAEILLEVVWAQRLTDEQGHLAAFGGRGPSLAAFGMDPE